MLEAAVPYCAMLLAAIFAWAALAKVVGWARWRAAVGRYHLGAAAGPVAVATPPAELALAALALFGPSRLAGVATLGVVALFSLAILRARGLHGDRLPCGCFGGNKDRDFRSLLARNVLIAVLGAVLALGKPRGNAFRGDDVTNAPDLLPLLLAAAGIGLGAWLLYEAGGHFVRRGR